MNNYGLHHHLNSQITHYRGKEALEAEVQTSLLSCKEVQGQSSQLERQPINGFIRKVIDWPQ